jgi:two-component system, cell cycle response regulator CpdR
MANILIVEDEDHLRVLTESCLREQGHVTFSAATKEQALAVLEVAKVDLLFVDVGLYDDREVGLDLAKEAIDRLPEMKVLYTTGQPVTDGMKALLVEDASLLPKPYTVEQLQTILSVKFGIKPVSAPAALSS